MHRKPHHTSSESASSLDVVDVTQDDTHMADVTQDDTHMADVTQDTTSMADVTQGGTESASSLGVADVTQDAASIRLPGTKVTFSIGASAKAGDFPQTGASGTNGDKKGTESLDILSDMDDEQTDDVAGHDNVVYQVDKTDMSPSKGHFVRTFGEKGNEFGELQDAKDITVLPRGRILITDLINNKIQVRSTDGKVVMECDDHSLQEPWATAVTGGHIAVTSCRNKCVVILSGKCRVKHSFGAHHFLCPTGITTNKKGQFIVCDSATNAVSLHDPDGTFINYIGRPENQEHAFLNPRYICSSVNGDIIISDSGHHKIKVFNADGQYIRSFGKFGKQSKQFKSPYGVCTNQLGDIFIADHYNNRITMYTGDGVFIRHIVTPEHGIIHPQGLAMSSDNDLYVTHGGLKAYEVMNFRLNASPVRMKSSNVLHV